MTLRPEVAAALRRHGVEPAEGESPEDLRERLEDVYVEAVRRLRARQRAGEIALRDYAAAADALKREYPLLGLPIQSWEE